MRQSRLWNRGFAATILRFVGLAFQRVERSMYNTFLVFHLVSKLLVLSAGALQDDR